MPAMADISTRTERVEVPDGSFGVHLTLPEGGDGPGVLLLQEIFGVNDFLLGKAAALGELGYVVSCPDVFWRIEENVSLPHDEAALARAFELVGRYNSEVDLDTKTADLVAALGHLRALPEVAGHKVAVMGYCLGGFLAYMTALSGGPDACVSYYGSGIAGQLSRAGELTCPVLFHFGGADPYIPASDVEAIEDTFSSRDDVTVRIEPEAGHAFENLLAPQFAVPDAAERSWRATLEWLGSNVA